MRKENKKDNAECELFDKHQELAKSGARNFISKYHLTGYDLKELEHFGLIGLWKASENYDATKGSFLPYAKEIVHYEILKSIIKEDQSIHVPQRIASKIKKIRKAKEELIQFLEREPSVDEIAERTKFHSIEIIYLNEISSYSWGLESLESPISENGERSLLDTITEKTPDEYNDIMSIINSWPEDEANIMKMRLGLDFGQKYSLKEIASELDISWERVVRIYDNKLRELRNRLGIDY